MEIIFNLTEPFYALTQGLDIIRPIFSFFNLEEGCKAQRSCYLVLFSPHKEYSISQIFKLLGPSLRYCVFFSRRKGKRASFFSERYGFSYRLLANFLGVY